MVVIDWVQEHLASEIAGDSFTFPDQAVTVADFCNFFGRSIEAAVAAGGSVYDALMTDTHVFVYEGETYSVTAAEMEGWPPVFDKWHVEGLI